MLSGLRTEYRFSPSREFNDYINSLKNYEEEVNLVYKYENLPEQLKIFVDNMILQSEINNCDKIGFTIAYGNNSYIDPAYPLVSNRFIYTSDDNKDISYKLKAFASFKGSDLKEKIKKHTVYSLNHEACISLGIQIDNHNEESNKESYLLMMEIVATREYAIERMNKSFDEIRRLSK